MHETGADNWRQKNLFFGFHFCGFCETSATSAPRCPYPAFSPPRPLDIVRTAPNFTDPNNTMRIWQKPLTLEILSGSHRDTAPAHLGMEFIEVGDDFLRARIPVDKRTRQPYGILHGGVSVVLAETLGSCGAYYALPMDQRAVGLDINANHIRGATDGWVTGVTRPVHRGRSTHVWHIDMFDDQERITCVSRITLSVLPLTERGRFPSLKES